MIYFQIVVMILMIVSVLYMIGSVLVGLTDGIPNVTLYSVALMVFILCVMIYFFVFIPHGNVAAWR
jgi:hypothetical protein